MKFKPGDGVKINNGYLAGRIGIVIADDRPIFPYVVVVFDGVSVAFSASELDLAEDPNELLKEIL